LPFIEALASVPASVTTGGETAAGEAWPLWMTTITAATYLDFSHGKNPRVAFACFVRRTGLVARGRRGDVPLDHRLDLDRAVTVIEFEAKKTAT
jgi:hypothetical protein